MWIIGRQPRRLEDRPPGRRHIDFPGGRAVQCWLNRDDAIREATRMANHDGNYEFVVFGADSIAAAQFAPVTVTPFQQPVQVG